MYVIKAVYDGKTFYPREPVPFNEEYEVVITFTDPVKYSDNNRRHFSKEEKENITKTLFGVLPSGINLDESRNERLR